VDRERQSVQSLAIEVITSLVGSHQC